MALVPPGLKKEVRRKHREIFNELARNITVISKPSVEEKTDCPNCFSSAGVSTNVFDSSFVSPVVIFGDTISPISFSRGLCPVCYGVGYLKNDNILSKCIDALVRWDPSGNDGRETIGVTQAGLEGSSVVRIEVKECHFDDVRDAEHFLVDGIKCSLIKPPVFRHLEKIDVTVVAYLMSVEVGHSSRDQ